MNQAEAHRLTLGHGHVDTDIRLPRTCAFTDMFTSCYRETRPDSIYCFFHDFGFKDTAQFEHELRQLFLTRAPWNLNGFIFPEVFPPQIFHIILPDRILPEISFIGARFPSPISFEGFEFTGPVNFFNAAFLSDVNFRGCGFLADARMSAYFNKTFFIGVRFASNAYFLSAHFYGDADYRDADFCTDDISAEANFSSSHFLKDADFAAARFHGRAIFDNSKFDGNLLFRQSENQLGRMRVFAQGIDFRGSVVNKAIFQSVDLSSARLLGTDISDFSLENIKWPRIGMSSSWNPLKSICNRFISRYSTFDELSAFKELKERHTKWNRNLQILPFVEKYKRKWKSRRWKRIDRFELAERLQTEYRYLKSNYNNCADYELAGDFHMGEMDMKLRQLRFFKTDWWLISAYRLVSSYGERWLKPLFYLLLILLLAPIIEMLGGVKINGQQIEYSFFGGTWNTHQALIDYSKTLRYDILIALLQRPNIESASEYCGWILILLVVTGPILVTLCLLALRRRMKR